MKSKKDISDLDKKNWDDYISNPVDIFDKEKKSNKKIKKGRFKFDLHGFSLLEANNKIKKIINYCVDNKYTEILLITGKGLHSNTKDNTYVSSTMSKLRYSIPDFINSDLDLRKKVISISQAKKDEGGSGALIIKLKNL